MLTNDSLTESFNFTVHLDLDDGSDSRKADAIKLKEGVYYTGYVNITPETWKWVSNIINVLEQFW